MQETAIQTPSLKNITGIATIFDWDNRDRGHELGLYSQAGIVELYGHRVNEELEYENVRTHPVETRRAKIMSETERLAEVPDGYVPLYLSCGWYDGKRKEISNFSVVEFSSPDLFKLAKRLCESLSDWGRCYVWGHRVPNPIVIDAPTPMIRIRPFALNGPHVDEYVRRMDKLGEEIGRAIGEYLRERGEGLRR